MKKLLMASMLLASLNAQADADAKLIVGYGSFHFDSYEREVLNQDNASIGLELYDVQAVYVEKNSFNEQSVYATYTPDYKINEYLSVSANVGFATGYKCDTYIMNGNIKTTPLLCSDSGLIPVAGFTIDYSPFANNFNLSLSVTPAVAMFLTNYNF